MANEIAVTEDHRIAVTIDGRKEVYDLNETLPETALIVKQEKNDILHQMDLQSVIGNLDNSVDLLNVSYHAVYGFPVQKKVFALQKTLMDLNNKGIEVINNFKVKSASIMADLKAIFHWLTKGKESIAMSKLKKFSGYAAGMSLQAEELAQDYEKMADNTSAVLQETMEESSKQYEKADQLKEMLAEFEANQASAEQMQKAIEADLKNLRQDYDRLIKQEEQEAKDRRTKEIVGMVFSFLGSAASVVTGNQFSGGSQQSQSASSPSASQTELEDKKKEEAKLEEQIEALNKEKSDLEEQLRAAVDGDGSEDEKKRLRAEITDLQKRIEELEKKKKEASAVVEKLGGMLKDMGSNLQDSAARSADASEQRNIRMNEIYNQMIKQEEENARQLGLIAKYTKQIEATVVTQQSTEAAVQALILAISCLKRVVVAVKDVALFWSSLEQSCRQLAESSLLEDIEAIQDLSLEERLEVYYDEETMYPLLCYGAKWTAIYAVSAEYIKAAEKTRFRLNESLVTSDSLDMSREQHWEQASQLAGEVGGRLELQIEESRNKARDLQKKGGAA